MDAAEHTGSSRIGCYAYSLSLLEWVLNMQQRLIKVAFPKWNGGQVSLSAIVYLYGVISIHLILSYAFLSFSKDDIACCIDDKGNPNAEEGYPFKG